MHVHYSPDSRMMEHGFLCSVYAFPCERSGGKVVRSLLGLDVAPKVTSKLMFRRSIQTILSAGLRSKVFSIY